MKTPKAVALKKVASFIRKNASMTFKTFREDRVLTSENESWGHIAIAIDDMIILEDISRSIRIDERDNINPDSFVVCISVMDTSSYITDMFLLSVEFVNKNKSVSLMNEIVDLITAKRITQ